MSFHVPQFSVVDDKTYLELGEMIRLELPDNAATQALGVNGQLTIIHLIPSPTSPEDVQVYQGKHKLGDPIAYADASVTVEHDPIENVDLYWVPTDKVAF